MHPLAQSTVLAYDVVIRFGRRITMGSQMRVGSICTLAAALVIASPAVADELAAWTNAAQLVERAWSDIQTGGILTVRPHAADLEAALAEGTRVGVRFVDGDTTYVLTDGAAETLFAMTVAANSDASQDGMAVAVSNPYPLMAMILGSYYNEIRQPGDGLRALEGGLAILDASGFEPGLSDYRPALVIERGMALTSLGRFEDALANFDDGLTIGGLESIEEARLLRGRGFALIELGRLDDAETAYHASLELEPGNPTAEHELGYIAQLKAGGSAAPPSLAPLPTPSVQ